MGFWDRPVENNGLDDIFDMNRDGTIDACEEAMEFNFLTRVSEGKDPWDDTHNLDADAEEEFMDELSMMDPEERRETLEDAGYDADDFDSSDFDGDDF